MQVKFKLYLKILLETLLQNPQHSVEFGAIHSNRVSLFDCEIHVSAFSLQKAWQFNFPFLQVHSSHLLR